MRYFECSWCERACRHCIPKSERPHRPFRCVWGRPASADNVMWAARGFPRPVPVPRSTMHRHDVRMWTPMAISRAADYGRVGGAPLHYTVYCTQYSSNARPTRQSLASHKFRGGCRRGRFFALLQYPEARGVRHRGDVHNVSAWAATPYVSAARARGARRLQSNAHPHSWSRSSTIDSRQTQWQERCEVTNSPRVHRVHRYHEH